MDPIVIGTRATPLARIQADLVARRLREVGLATVVRAMSSQGDRSLGGSFAQAKGVFTGELSAALRDGSVDLVVHSLKDLPVENEPGLVIAAVPERERPFDLLLFAPKLEAAGAVGAAEAAEAAGTAGPTGPAEATGAMGAAGAAGSTSQLEELLEGDETAVGESATPATEAFALLPAGARLGTSSPRRQAGALAIRRDLVCCAVRGSVGRRLEWLRSGAIDALLAAEAGVLRLARSGALDGSAAAVRGFRLDLRSWPCAPGQGALAVQILRGGRLDGHLAMAALDHAPSRVAVLAERGLLGRLGGGCLRPFGAWAEVGDGESERPAPREVHALIAPDDWRESAAAGEAPGVVHAAAAAADGDGGGELDALAERLERDLGGVDAGLAAGGVFRPPSAAAGQKTRAPSAGRKTRAPRERKAPDETGIGVPDLVVTSSPIAVRRLTGRLDPRIRVAALPATEVEVFDTPWPAGRIELERPRRRWPWLLVSSPTAARVVVERAERDPVWGRLPWCALGEGTARALLAAGVPPNLAARASGGEDFAGYAARVLDPRCPLFVPHSARGGAPLVEALEAAGREVTAWAAYTVHPKDDLGWPEGWQAARARVLFTAPSAVAAFPASGLDWPGSCWAIGATTAAALRSAGAGNVKCAHEPTAAGIERLWRERTDGATASEASE